MIADYFYRKQDLASSLEPEINNKQADQTLNILLVDRNRPVNGQCFCSRLDSNILLKI